MPNGTIVLANLRQGRGPEVDVEASGKCRTHACHEVAECTSFCGVSSRRLGYANWHLQNCGGSIVLSYFLSAFGLVLDHKGELAHGWPITLATSIFASSADRQSLVALYPSYASGSSSGGRDVLTGYAHRQVRQPLLGLFAMSRLSFRGHRTTLTDQSCGLVLPHLNGL